MTTGTLQDVPPARAAAAPAVTVFVCGDRHRGDDAVAFAIARLLRPTLGARVALVEDGMLDAGMLVDLPEGQRCIVVDAVTGVPAGEVVSLPLERLAAVGRERGLRCSAPTARSTHLVSVETSLALAALLLGEPVRGTFVGVGIRNCAFGAPLSPEVADAVPEAVEAVVAAVQSLEPGRPS